MEMELPKIIEGIVFEPPEYEFSLNDFETMTSALGKEKMSDQCKKDLQNICRSFLLVLTYSTIELSNVDIREKLEKMRSGAQRMLETLHSLYSLSETDRVAHEALEKTIRTAHPDNEMIERDSHYSGSESERAARQVAEQLLNNADENRDWLRDGEDLIALAELLTNFGSAARTAISNIPRNLGGRPKDHAIEFLIPLLAKIFFEATGKEAKVTTNPEVTPDAEYGGKFLLFVEVFLEPISAHYSWKSNNLGKKIKRILNRK
jgi:hypothetical protein